MQEVSAVALSDREHSSPPQAARARAQTLVMLVISAVLGALIALALFAGFRPAPGGASLAAAPSRLADLQASFISVAERIRPSVVNINTEQEIRRRVWGVDLFNFDPRSNSMPPFRPQTRVETVNSLGSGVVVSPEGFILTNAHVIAGADRMSVTLSDDTTYPARFVAADPSQDLAIIRSDRHQPGHLLPRRHREHRDRLRHPHQARNQVGHYAEDSRRPRGDVAAVVIL